MLPFFPSTPFLIFFICICYSSLTKAKLLVQRVIQFYWKLILPLKRNPFSPSELVNCQKCVQRKEWAVSDAQCVYSCLSRLGFGFLAYFSVWNADKESCNRTWAKIQGVCQTHVPPAHKGDDSLYLKTPKITNVLLWFSFTLFQLQLYICLKNNELHTNCSTITLILHGS